MRASRTNMAVGAVLAGFAFAASGTPAEANARAVFGFHGQHVAFGGGPRGRFDAFHRHFNHPFDGDRRVWGGRRNGFGGYGFGGYGLGGYGFGDYGLGGDDAQPTVGASQAAPVFLSVYAGPNIYPPPDPMLGYGPPPQGPKIIELGRRAPKRIRRPVVIYGDSP
ncbi:MAG TPA: hypothetical protein VGH40_21380 [Roseiarcus sp.]